MAGVLQRTLAILELLAVEADGVALATVADRVDMPKSAAHRLLSELTQTGYVRQLRNHGDYVLTTKLVSLGLTFLSTSGIVDIAQPVLDRVAEGSGELVRLAVIDGSRLTWVAKAQGARRGLRYDPEMGQDVPLACTATGQAWLLALSDEEALERVAQQGFGRPDVHGPNAPRTAKSLLKCLAVARRRGFSVTVETFAAGMAAMAAPVARAGEPPIAVISVAGPHVRFTEARMLALGPELVGAARELASASSASAMLRGLRHPSNEPHVINTL